MGREGRERLVSLGLNPLLARIPERFTEIYDYQVDAVSEIVEAFDDGESVVVLDAPTGTGKTVMAEIVRNMLGTRAAYVCHNKDLQTQFSGEFGYSRVLYGRANYTPTRRQIIPVTCEDCTYGPDRQCDLCDQRETCPYIQAKNQAIHSPVPVLNSAYWLSEVQGRKSRFANTGLVVFDEADTLEGVLMGQVEIYIGERMQGKYGIRAPRMMTKGYEEWGEEVVERLGKQIARLGDESNLDIKGAREYRSLVSLHQGITRMCQDIKSESPWVYTGGAGSRRRAGSVISFKPVKVSGFGEERIWSRDKRFLLMSATIVSAGQLLGDLGWTGEYKCVTMDSPFHPRNRQVVVRPTLDMTRRGQENEKDPARLDRAVSRILGDHQGQRVLIHTVSYSLTDRVFATCERTRPGLGIRYEPGGRSRSDAVRRFKQTVGSVLVAPSLDRGIDLAGELCRAQVVAKMPRLSLGDKQTGERLWNTKDGDVWYNVYTARTLMQMVGRGVRNTEDYCVCYVIDADFVKWYREWGHLLPKWFRRAIRVESGEI